MPIFPLPGGAILCLGRPDRRTLQRVQARFERLPLSYDTPRMTVLSRPPAGMQAEASDWPLGEGEAAFRAAGAALDAWATHDLRWPGLMKFCGRWLTLHADGPPEPGRTVVLDLGVGPLRLLCGCRVLDVWRTPDAHGYRYATLPGHPERGEEVFSVERHGEDVRLHLLAYSRPAGPLYRSLRPLALALRRAGSRGYGRNLHRAVQAANGEADAVAR